MLLTVLWVIALIAGAWMIILALAEALHVASPWIERGQWVRAVLVFLLALAFISYVVGAVRSGRIDPY